MRVKFWNVFFAVTFAFLGSFSYCYGQQFVNGDLEGIVGGLNVPLGWMHVPMNDLNCMATSNYSATPDITDMSGPKSTNGVFGRPNSGSTFISGLNTITWPITGVYYHEGVMQRVDSFNVGCFYEISFYQSVVKQSLTDALDTSGSWAVYLDDSLIDISKPTISMLSYDDPELIWEFRSINFQAWKSSYMIKFLPTDDDTSHYGSSNNDGLRMGLDNIKLTTSLGQKLLKKNVFICPNEKKELKIKNDNVQFIEWQNGSNDRSIVVNGPGVYWVKVTNGCGTFSDTVEVIESQSECSCNWFMPNAFTPNGDNLNDTFYPIGKCSPDNYDFRIFNRWGQMIFRSNTLNKGWDGTINNEKASLDTYFYLLSYTNQFNESFQEQGHVLLIR